MYTLFPIQDAILEEIKEAGFVGEAIHRVKKVVIKLNYEGICYDITYFEDFPNEVTTSINAEKSNLLDSLNIDAPIFSKDGKIRMGLCEVLVEVEASRFPELQIKYELLGKGS